MSMAWEHLTAVNTASRGLTEELLADVDGRKSKFDKYYTKNDNMRGESHLTVEL